LIFLAVMSLSVVVVSTMFWGYQKRTTATVKNEISHEISMTIQELNSLVYEALLHPEQERISRQWQATVHLLNKLMAKEEQYFNLPEERILMEVIHKDIDIIQQAFKLLKQTQQTTHRPDNIMSNREARLASQVQVKARHAILHISKLDKQIKEKIIREENYSGWMIILISILLPLFIFGALFFTERKISQPIVRLKKGIDIVAAGDLTHKTQLSSQDEIGQLSLAFDKMTEQLQETMASREELIQENKERKRAQAALKVSHKNLTNAMRIASITNWEWDIINDIFWWSNEVFRILGFEPMAIEPSYQAFLNAVHPDDQQIFIEAMKSAQQTKQFYAFEHRIIKPDQSERIILEQIQARYNTEDKPIQISGTIQDITEQKRAEDELRQHREQLEETVKTRTMELTATVEALQQRSNESELITQLGDMLQACESDTESYAIMSSSCEQLFSRRSGFLALFDEELGVLVAVLGFGRANPYQIVFDMGDCWALRRGNTHQVIDSQTGPICKHPHGEQTQSSLCIPIGAKGKFLGILHMHWDKIEDSSENHHKDMQVVTNLARRVAELYSLSLSNIRLRYQLKQQSIIDPLTGLFNRRHMESSLKRELNRAKRAKTQVGVLLMDVDYFKQFNDKYGHDAGDLVLKKLGLFLLEQTRAEDIACRYGGEELLLIFPDCSVETCLQKAEQIRCGVENLKVQHNNASLQIKISIGTAMYPDNGDTAESIIIEADSALYRAKEAGRNKVVKA